MRTAATTALPNETGGILLGYRTLDGVRVTGAIEVPDRRATGTSYRRSHRHASRKLATALALEPAGSPVGYVGEWHSHPAPQPPSAPDLTALVGCR
jgi:proteasome lid subunit RPN8/RPN11